MMGKTPAVRSEKRTIATWKTKPRKIALSTPALRAPLRAYRKFAPSTASRRTLKSRSPAARSPPVPRFLPASARPQEYSSGSPPRRLNAEPACSDYTSVHVHEVYSPAGTASIDPATGDRVVGQLRIEALSELRGHSAT